MPDKDTIFGVFVVVKDDHGREHLTLTTLHRRKDGEDANTAKSAAALYGGKVMPLSILD